MSYCRWSTDSFRCDLYCYEDVRGGFTTHVAGNRIPDDGPREDFRDFIEGRMDKFMADHKALMDYLDGCPRSHIGLAYDGQTFNDPDLPSFLARLKFLREAGYRFPDSVLRSVEEEIEELAAKPSLQGETK